MNLRSCLSPLACALSLLVGLADCKPSAPDGTCVARVAMMREVFASIPSEVLEGVFLESLRVSDLIVSAHARTPPSLDVLIELHATGRFSSDNKEGDLQTARYAVSEGLERYRQMAAIMAQERKQPPPPSGGLGLGERPTQMQLDPERFVGYLDTPDFPPEEESDAADGSRPARPPPKSAPGAQVYLAIAPDAPLHDLPELLAEVPDDAFVSIVVRRAEAQPTQAGLPPPIRTALTEVEAHMAVVLADRRLASDDEPIYVDTLVTCPDFAQLAQGPKGSTYAERERRWLDEVPRIALGCGCEGVKVELLTAQTWYRIRPDLPILGALPLRYTFEPDPTGEALPATARGVDLVRKIEQRGAQPVHLTRPAPPRQEEP